MASQPRKFSEKIALHNQKQAEGDAAFQQIMREVTDVTSNPARSNLEDLHCSRVDSNTVYRERGRSVGSGGPMRSRPTEKRVDTSPYSHGPYLSPPSTDPSWRRTNSDSALHQSVQNPNSTLLHSPGSQRRVAALENHQHYDSSRTRHLSVSCEKRPRSCCGVPSIPDINIFPSQQEPGAVQIPIGNNTGSLPDLTSFQFSSPIHTPLDQDDRHSSTYSSTSPQCTSPSTLSPTSLPPRTPGRFSFGSTPPHESSGPPSYTSISPPSPSSSKHLSVPSTTAGYLPTPKGYILDGSPVDSNSYQIQSQIQQQQEQQQSLHQKSQPMNHQQQQVQQTYSKQQILRQSQQQSSQNHLPQMQPQRPTHYTFQQTSSPQRQSPVSTADVPCSDSIVLNHRNSMNSYRSPQSANRRSPQSSPILNIKQYSNNTSPLSSAPQSPTSSCNSISSNNQHQPYNSSNDYYTQAQQTLEQHFEQIRMLDSPVSSTVDYMIPISNGPSNSYQQVDDMCSVGTNELTIDQGYYSTSPSQQLQYCTAVNSAQTTPNTPSSIPDIVLTDFSTTGDELRRDMSKDLGCDISNFLGDVRDGLDPIDFDGLQILTQDILNSDPSSQQHFPLDSL